MIVRPLAKLSWVVFAAGGIVVTACSQKAATSPAATCTTYVNALFGLVQKCDPAAAPPAQVGHLESRYDDACQRGLLAPNSGLTSDLVDACSDALVLAAGACTDSLTSLPACNFPAGTIPNGTTCAFDNQCISNFCDFSSLAATADGTSPARGVHYCGTCKERLLPGGDCSSLTDRCADGTVCYGKVCTPKPKPVGLGGPCVLGIECSPPNFCDAAKKVCVAPGGQGANCFAAFECDKGFFCNQNHSCVAVVTGGGACAPGACAAGFGCDGASNTCRPVTFAPADAKCDGDATQCAEGTCQLQTNTPQSRVGTCPTILVDGSGCDPASTVTICDVQAVCVGGKCQVADATNCQ